MTRLGSWFRHNLPAIIAFFAVLGLWEALTTVLQIETFIIPKPSQIIQSFAETGDIVLAAGWKTLQEAISGLVLGTVAGVLVSFASARWLRLREGLLPLAVALNSMPIVALAPIFNNWFGIANPFSKIIVVAVVVFFPVMINTTRGLLEVDQNELELMRSLAATPASIMRRVRIPNSLPFFFSSLKVATSLSLIMAIVAEYFGGAQDVLGQYILNKAQLLQLPAAWTGIVLASVIGIAFYLVVLAAERMFMPWHSSLQLRE